ncbi:MAG: GTPase Era [Phytoplasma sp.]|uniref:GTPase Era n=1 Tax=Phytoplasma sp. TaxID=2155 RepID=UPI002B404AC3|nr:GTPase Era [Phytoplasma sp.]WRH06752.1 MAG: GTPase Era [Phytoplasma sp.]
MFKSGFITMIGKTNVGKSTLLNSLLEQKISITSDKHNTTKQKILGVCNNHNYQLVFIDNPGLIYKKKDFLISKFNFVALKNFEEVDVVLFLVNDKCQQADKDFLNFIQKYKKKIILIITKIDLFNKTTSIDKIILSYLKYFQFDAIIPLSSVKNQNLNILKENIVSLLDEGKLYFPKNFITNLSKEDLILEFVREKIFYYLAKELPHVCSVFLDNIIYDETNASVKLDVIILLPKISQKKILIGTNGSNLKKIRIAAQKDIKNFLKKKISLNLWVKVDSKFNNRKIFFDAQFKK